MDPLSKLFYYWRVGGVNELATAQKTINSTDNGQSYFGSPTQKCLIAINYAAVWWLMCMFNELVQTWRLICWGRGVTNLAHLILQWKLWSFKVTWWYILGMKLKEWVFIGYGFVGSPRLKHWKINIPNGDIWIKYKT